MEEIPIPTYYGDEICYVNGFGYARDVVADAARYRLARMGIRTGRSGDEDAPSSGQLELKQAEGTSHQLALAWLRSHLPGAVLDVGCGAGHLAALAEAAGHEVTGVDVEAGVGVAGRMTRFVPADLDRGLPDGLGGPFDLVVLADVLEHLRHPETLLAAVVELLRPGGEVFVTVPNFGHWYPRLRTAAGRFDYDDRGILDRDHVRFFTERSFRRLLGASGLELRSLRPVSLPLERLEVGGRNVPAWLGGVDRAAAASLPGLCAYQFAAVLRKPPAPQPTQEPRPWWRSDHRGTPPSLESEAGAPTVGKPPVEAQ
jgi:SAM-dependent methyltransferase